MKCTKCGSPERMIWPPSSEAPKFTDVASVNWMTLGRCSECGRLWAGVPYEPYASFMYYVAWPQDEEEWNTQIQKEEGAALHSWHKSQLKAYSSTLTTQDLKAIEAHRERSFGRDPYSEA